MIVALFVLDLVARRRVDPRKGSLVTAGAAGRPGSASLPWSTCFFGRGCGWRPARCCYEVFGNAFSYATEGRGFRQLLRARRQPFNPGLAISPLRPVRAVADDARGVAGRRARARLRFFVSTAFNASFFCSLILVGVLFIVLFGLASGRNSAHYVLTSYVALDILAGAGFVCSWPTGSSVGDSRPSGAAVPAVVLARCCHCYSGGQRGCHSFRTTTPTTIRSWKRREPGLQDPNFGYGEGLDLAAAYLRRMPAAADSTVMAFYGRGPFSYFYPGTTEPLKTVYADAENVPQLQQILREM